MSHKSLTHQPPETYFYFLRDSRGILGGLAVDFGIVKLGMTRRREILNDPPLQRTVPQP